MAQEPERIEIRIEPALSLAEREELLIRLQHQVGVVSAWFDDRDRQRLLVHVEPEHFSATTLLDFVGGLGAHGRLHG